MQKMSFGIFYRNNKLLVALYEQKSVGGSKLK